MNTSNSTQTLPAGLEWTVIVLWTNCGLGFVLFVINTGILFASKYTSGGKSPTLIFIRSLCVADTFIALAPVVKAFETPAQLMMYKVNINCFLGESVLYTGMFASSFLILGFTMDNYLRMVSPVRYINTVDKSLVITFMIFIWNGAFIFGFVPQMGWNIELLNGQPHACQLFEYYDTSYIITMVILIAMALVTTCCLHLDFFFNVQKRSLWTLNSDMFRKNMYFMNGTRIELLLTTVAIASWFTYFFLFSKIGLFYRNPNSENFYLILFSLLLGKAFISTFLHLSHAEQILQVIAKVIRHMFRRCCKNSKGISRYSDRNATTRSTVSVISVDDSISPGSSSSRERRYSHTTDLSTSVENFKICASRSASNETQISVLPSSCRTNYQRFEHLISEVPSFKLKRSQSLCTLKPKPCAPLRVTFSDSIAQSHLETLRKLALTIRREKSVQNLTGPIKQPLPKIVLHEVTADVHQDPDKNAKAGPPKLPPVRASENDENRSPNFKRPLVRSKAGLWDSARMDSLKVPALASSSFKRSRLLDREFQKTLKELKLFKKELDGAWNSDCPQRTKLPQADNVRLSSVYKYQIPTDSTNMSCQYHKSVNNSLGKTGENDTCSANSGIVLDVKNVALSSRTSHSNKKKLIFNKSVSLASSKRRSVSFHLEKDVGLREHEFKRVSSTKRSSSDPIRDHKWVQSSSSTIGLLTKVSDRSLNGFTGATNLGYIPHDDDEDKNDQTVVMINGTVYHDDATMQCDVVHDAVEVTCL